MVTQEKLLEELKSLSDSIRKKNTALRLGINERDKFLETTFKPVIEPIKTLSNKIARLSPLTDGDVVLLVSKEENKEEDYYENNDESEDDIERENDQSEGMGEKDSDESDEPEDAEEEGMEDEEQSTPSNISKLGSDIILKGELGRNYVLKMLHSAISNRRYHVYGARMDDNGLMIGNSTLNVDNEDNIYIGKKRYKGTVGLFELLFKNKPVKYTKNDLATFKKICKATNAHKKKYEAKSLIYRNQYIKYKTIVSGLFPKKLGVLKEKQMSSGEINVLHKNKRANVQNSSGEGLLKDNTNVIYYNNLNKLVERMKFIYEAKQAGHTGLENEWVALTKELRNRGIVV